MDSHLAGTADAVEMLNRAMTHPYLPYSVKMFLEDARNRLDGDLWRQMKPDPIVYAPTPAQPSAL